MNRRSQYISALALSIATAGLCCVIAPTPLQAQSQGEMNQQAAKDFDRADAEMNTVYKRLMKSLRPGDQALLRDSQRAWLKFRDTDVKFRAAKGKGGSIYPMLVASYKAQLTRDRTKELREAEDTFRTEGAM